MRILLTGQNGQVGFELERSLLPLGEVIAVGRQEADLSDSESLRRIVRETKPDVIVNAAAYTAVDKAEEEEELATAINGIAPGVLADEAKKQDALLVHYSTDYVFDGSKEEAYNEDDEPSPVNAYGRSKLAGERAIESSECNYLILRTSWVYAARGKNFVLTMLKLAAEREALSIVSDQIGSPTWARLIAGTSSHCIKQAYAERVAGNFDSGLFHLTAAGSTSWHGFAEQIVDMAVDKLDLHPNVRKINGIPTSEYPTPARRPMNSRLAGTKLEKRFNVLMPSWEKCLGLCLEEMR